MERLPNLLGLDREALGAVFEGLGQPAYRARQVYAWLYQKRVRSIAAMTDLPKDVRERLAAAYEVRWPEVAERGDQRSQRIAIETEQVVKPLHRWILTLCV